MKINARMLTTQLRVLKNKKLLESLNEKCFFNASKCTVNLKLSFFFFEN